MFLYPQFKYTKLTKIKNVLVLPYILLIWPHKRDSTIGKLEFDDGKVLHTIGTIISQVP